MDGRGNGTLDLRGGEEEAESKRRKSDVRWRTSRMKRWKRGGERGALHRQNMN